MELCRRCKKEPAQLYTRRIDGKEVQLALCPACYRALYPAAGGDVVPSFGTAGKGRCPSCGTTLADFRATGLLGCAKCYETFRNELLPTIRYLHGSDCHTGKQRSANEERYDMLRALVEEQERLRLRLRRAREDGDTESEERLLGRLDAIAKRLSGEEE